MTFYSRQAKASSMMDTEKNYWETRKFASSSSEGGTEMSSLYTEGYSAMLLQANEGLVLKMHNLIKRKTTNQMEICRPDIGFLILVLLNSAIVSYRITQM